MWAFVVPKLLLLFTPGWSAQPYSINFGVIALIEKARYLRVL